MSRRRTGRLTATAALSACGVQQTKPKDLSIIGTSVTGLLSLSIYLDPHFKRCFLKRSFYRGGGEDVRLKAADCPGDWTHWGEALERQQPGRPGGTGACGEDAGCAGASPTGQPLTHVLVNHTHNHEHRKFGKVQGLISQLGLMSCFSEVG